MYYSDYHMHTQLSSDSHATLEAQCHAAIACGLSEICVTDHWNMVDQQAAPLPRTYNWDATRNLILSTRDQFFGQLDIRMGIEVGNDMIDVPAVESGLRLGKLDFVIGSLHNVSEQIGAEGIYTLAHRCKSQSDCTYVMEDYMSLLETLVRGDNYDVLGHIIYPIRYFPKEYAVSLSTYWDQLAEILKIIIAKGKGIEINTSQGTTIQDWQPILELYHQLGGEILTTGADAHFNEKVGAGIIDATQLIAQCGFRYVNVYRQRIPHFIKIN